MFSMLEVGMVKLTPQLDTTFWRNLKPITDKYDLGALHSIGMTRQQTLSFGDPEQAIRDLVEWVESVTVGRPCLVSDNNGFDAAYVNYYCHFYLGRNPFGHSSRRIGDFFSGLERDWSVPHRKWKKLRKTIHTHNALDDAIGNAQALCTLAELHNIQLPDK
jgi:hypothetical protein